LSSKSAILRKRKFLIWGVKFALKPEVIFGGLVLCEEAKESESRQSPESTNIHIATGNINSIYNGICNGSPT
jgi:hypothetical protein